MRNGSLALLALAALASTTLATPTDADACGGYVHEPRVLMVSSHRVRTFTKVPGWATRSFAVLDEKVPAAGLSWTLLAPGTYDSTQIAPGSASGPSLDLSLVNGAGAQRFHATDRVFLRHTFGRNVEHAALALPTGDFRIAIVGEHDDKARFLGLEYNKETNADRDWVSRHGLNADDAYLSVSPIQGTKLVAISVTPRLSGPTVTLIRSGEALHERLSGSILGGLVFRGATYVLVVEHNVLRARAL